MGVEAERFSEVELFLLRRCESIAAVVRGIIVGGGIEMEGGGIPCSIEVEEEADSSNSGSEG